MQMNAPGQIASREASRLRETVFEFALAIAALSSWPILGDRRQGSAEQRARSTLFLPVVGLIFGVALALTDHALSPFASRLPRSVIVIAISIAASGAIYPAGLAHAVGQLRSGSRPSWTGLTEVGPMGLLAAAAFIAVEIYLLGSIAQPPARARAIVLATMLSRWAIVPIGYGLKPLDRPGLGVQWEGGIRFREFAGSSVIALGTAMGFYDAVAIAAIVMLASTILAMRLLFSRRIGGVSGFALAAGAAISELVAFATLAAMRF